MHMVCKMQTAQKRRTKIEQFFTHCWLEMLHGRTAGPARSVYEAMNVLELPSDVAAAVLSSWIDVKALAKLDSALCAAESRTRFLVVVGDESFVAETMCMLWRGRYVQHLEWLAKRRMKIRNWIVNWDMVDSCTPDVLKYTAGPHVRSLRLRGLPSLGTARVLSTLAGVCDNLEILEIENCQHWEALSTFSALLRRSLQQLTIAYCDGHYWEPCAQFDNLRKLYVQNLYGMNVTQSMTSLLNAAPNLTDLRLSSYTQCPINDECLHILSNHAARLEILELDIEHQVFSPAAVISLAERCIQLKTLALLCGRSVNDTAVAAFALHCDRLEGLQLSDAFTVASLAALGMHCGSRLRYLSLDMSSCAAVGLVAIADHCLNLEELHLSNCKFLTDDPLLRLVSSLPRLRELLLVDSSPVSDNVLTATATYLPNLQHLSLRGCGGSYTEVGALALITSLTQLQRFCIGKSDTSVFTPALRRRWQEVSLGLKFYTAYLISSRHFERMRW
jgi:hypothetical protein